MGRGPVRNLYTYPGCPTRGAPPRQGRIALDLALDRGEEQAGGARVSFQPIFAQRLGSGSLSPLSFLRPQSSKVREETSPGVLVAMEAKQ